MAGFDQRVLLHAGPERVRRDAGRDGRLPGRDQGSRPAPRGPDAQPGRDVRAGRGPGADPARGQRRVRGRGPVRPGPVRPGRGEQRPGAARRRRGRRPVRRAHGPPRPVRACRPGRPGRVGARHRRVGGVVRRRPRLVPRLRPLRHRGPDVRPHRRGRAGERREGRRVRRRRRHVDHGPGGDLQDRLPVDRLRHGLGDRRRAGAVRGQGRRGSEPFAHWVFVVEALLLVAFTAFWILQTLQYAEDGAPD